ncbi:hypothetical protein [Pararobbsia silviterrae]|uniref:Uncharacterized protein n=1 Tax=Pararobbsia silviterrae TaxID=1792498 RepID=A0A494XHQ6_9BURK|nr:hypothetical protein [Pararobbsia silviterrae]RKP47699.1 hypothetical protein D7S86_22290 [Pararobbsia silviterrae]
MASALYLAGCSTSTPPRAAVQPVVAAAMQSPATVARPGVQEQVLAEANDGYVLAAQDQDIVYVDGSTYIWTTGPDGHRHRHLYGHGDLRREIVQRRDNLRAANATRLPNPAVVGAKRAPAPVPKGTFQRAQQISNAQAQARAQAAGQTQLHANFAAPANGQHATTPHPNATRPLTNAAAAGLHPVQASTATQQTHTAE